jgi:hypothetical protein
MESAVDHGGVYGAAHSLLISSLHGCDDEHPAFLRLGQKGSEEWLLLRQGQVLVMTTPLRLTEEERFPVPPVIRGQRPHRLRLPAQSLRDWRSAEAERGPEPDSWQALILRFCFRLL